MLLEKIILVERKYLQQMTKDRGIYFATRWFSNNLVCIILDRTIHKKFRNVFKDEFIAIGASEYFKRKISVNQQRFKQPIALRGTANP